jgi:hypothetical protein
VLRMRIKKIQNFPFFFKKKKKKNTFSHVYFVTRGHLDTCIKIHVVKCVFSDTHISYVGHTWPTVRHVYSARTCGEM